MINSNNDFLSNPSYNRNEKSMFEITYKFKLRNMNDLMNYVQQQVDNIFDKNFQNQIIDYMLDILKYEIIFETL